MTESILIKAACAAVKRAWHKQLHEAIIAQNPAHADLPELILKIHDCDDSIRAWTHKGM